MIDDVFSSMEGMVRHASREAKLGAASSDWLLSGPQRQTDVSAGACKVVQ